MAETADVLELARKLAAMPAGNMSTDNPEKYAQKRELHRQLREALKQFDGGPVEAPKEEKVKMATPMETTTNVSVEIYRKLTQEFGIGKRHQTKTADAAKAIGVTDAVLSNRVPLYQHLGVLKQEIEWEWQKQKVFWTMLKPAYEGEKIIREWFESGKSLNSVPRKTKPKAVEPVKAPEPVAEPVKGDEHGTSAEHGMGVIEETPKVAVRMNGETPVEAIAGPDAPSPFEALRAIRKDETGALIEAAKQYVGRKDAVEQSFRNLEAMGITIDREKAMAAVSFEKDQVLETVATLLPYITTLENKVAQADTWKNEVVWLRKEKGTLQDMVNREQAANKRLSERMAAMRATS